jgi:ribulose-phosphate 3-epimerase
MSEKKILIAPSILSADFRSLEREVKAVEDAGADMIHCDVMDGRFVPNISFGPMVVEAVKKCVSIPLDVHLMIVQPEQYIRAFRDAGADIITVHAEICADVPEAISMIHATGARAGITVNPDKPVSLFLPYLRDIDLVLVMSVYAGFGGQKFIGDTMAKVAEVYAEARRIGHDTLIIEVDGGINGDTARTAAAHGADALVAGSYVYGGNDYRMRIDAVRRGAHDGWQAKKVG